MRKTIYTYCYSFHQWEVCRIVKQRILQERTERWRTSVHPPFCNDKTAQICPTLKILAFHGNLPRWPRCRQLHFIVCIVFISDWLNNRHGLFAMGEMWPKIRVLFIFVIHTDSSYRLWHSSTLRSVLLVTKSEAGQQERTRLVTPWDMTKENKTG